MSNRYRFSKWTKNLIWETLTTLTEEPMPTKPEEGILRTTDPLRAAALLSFGIRLIDATPTKEGNRLVFVFDDTNDAARLASACFLQDRPVGVQTFVTNLRKCRELIYQYKISGGEGR